MEVAITLAVLLLFYTFCLIYIFCNRQLLTIGVTYIIVNFVLNIVDFYKIYVVISYSKIILIDNYLFQVSSEPSLSFIYVVSFTGCTYIRIALQKCITISTLSNVSALYGRNI